MGARVCAHKHKHDDQQMLGSLQIHTCDFDHCGSQSLGNAGGYVFLIIMHACLYDACLHVCMFCMHACVHTYMYACMHTCMYACVCWGGGGGGGSSVSARDEHAEICKFVFTVDVVSSPQKADQSFAHSPAAITSLPLLTVPATTGT